MTTTAAPERAVGEIALASEASEAAGTTPRRTPRRATLIDAAISVPLTAAVLVLLAWNIGGFPGASDDEGTYLAQAWAVQQGTGLAHYTYWYDHPPLGWIQLAALSWLPAAFSPQELAVATGRIAMLPVAGVCLLMVYVLCRRLSFSRWAAALALLAYGLSPLSVTMMRQIYLDSFAVMWILAALVLVLSPRKHLWHYTAAGAAVAIAVLSKETMVLVVPAVVVGLWLQTRHTTIRPWAFGGFGGGLTLIGAFYPLYAAIKGEFWPGADHVSLIGAWQFQLQQRAGSGGIFTPGSNSNLILHDWLYYDTVLLVGGVAAAAVGLFVRRLRAPAIAVTLLALVAMRPNGYLPAMYVVQVLPFLAIVLVGLVEIVVKWRPRPVLRWSIVAILMIAAIGYVTPRWYDGGRRAVISRSNISYVQTVAWMRANVVDRGSAVVVTDDVLWLDLVNAGFQRDNVLWFYKVDLDPAVSARLPNGWRDVDYVVSSPAMRQDPDALPTVATILHNSELVRVFGEADASIEIRRVNKEAS